MAAAGEINDAVLFDPDATGAFAIDIARQPFEAARRGIGAQDDAARAHHPPERGQNRIAHRFHAGCRDLHDADIAEAVDNQTRQTIAFGMDEAVIGRRIKPFAQPQGASEFGLYIPALAWPAFALSGALLKTTGVAQNEGRD